MDKNITELVISSLSKERMPLNRNDDSVDVYSMCQEFLNSEATRKKELLLELEIFFNNRKIVLLWEDSFIAAGELEDKGMIVYSDYNAPFVKDIFELSKKYGKNNKEVSFFYSFFLKAGGVRRLQILKDKGFKYLAQYEKNIFIGSLTETFTRNFNIIIYIMKDKIVFLKEVEKQEVLKQEPKQEPKQEDKQENKQEKHKVVINDLLEPVHVYKLENSVKEYFHKNPKFIYLFTAGEESNISTTIKEKEAGKKLSFFNINRFPAGVMVTPFPLIIMRVSFEDETYMYAIYNIEKERISEAFYSDDKDTLSVIKQYEYNSSRTNLSPLYEPTEKLNVTTTVVNMAKRNYYVDFISRSFCEKIKNNASLYLLNKFIDGYKIKILIKDFDTVVKKDHEFISEEEFEKRHERNRALKIKQNRVITITPYGENVQNQIEAGIYPEADQKDLKLKLGKIEKPRFIEEFLRNIKIN